MLCVPDLESYLSQIPKFLTLRGLFSWMRLRETISPVDFLTFLNFIKKYQNRDFATTVFGAKILILYNLGVGWDSVGKCRPMTWYSLRRPVPAVKTCQPLFARSVSMLREMCQALAVGC